MTRENIQTLLLATIGILVLFFLFKPQYPNNKKPSATASESLASSGSVSATIVDAGPEIRPDIKKVLDAITDKQVETKFAVVDTGVPLETTVVFPPNGRVYTLTYSYATPDAYFIRYEILNRDEAIPHIEMVTANLSGKVTHGRKLLSDLDREFIDNSISIMGERHRKYWQKVFDDAVADTVQYIEEKQ